MTDHKTDYATVPIRRDSDLYDYLEQLQEESTMIESRAHAGRYLMRQAMQHMEAEDHD